MVAVAQETKGKYIRIWVYISRRSHAMQETPKEADKWPRMGCLLKGAENVNFLKNKRVQKGRQDIVCLFLITTHTYALFVINFVNE